MTLEEIVQQLRDAQTVTAAQTLRHEARLKEHQQWLEANELAYAKHRDAIAEFDEKMTQLAAAQLVTEEKLNGLIDALRRGGNGHN